MRQIYSPSTQHFDHASRITAVFGILREMRLVSLFFTLLLLVSCGRTGPAPFLSSFTTGQRPLVAFKAIEDRAQTDSSSEAALALSGAVIDRLNQKGRLTLTTKGEQFLVKMKLVQHEELPQVPPELSMSIQLEILDVRTASTQVILHEVISYNTLLQKPLLSTRLIKWEDEGFRISPLGLAHAKLSREIASRIEDYVLLARKG